MLIWLGYPFRLSQSRQLMQEAMLQALAQYSVHIRTAPLELIVPRHDIHPTVLVVSSLED
jgi:hypothetical protein